MPVGAVAASFELNNRNLSAAIEDSAEWRTHRFPTVSGISCSKLSKRKRSADFRTLGPLFILTYGADADNYVLLRKIIVLVFCKLRLTYYNWYRIKKYLLFKQWPEDEVSSNWKCKGFSVYMAVIIDFYFWGEFLWDLFHLTFPAAPGWKTDLRLQEDEDHIWDWLWMLLCWSGENQVNLWADMCKVFTPLRCNLPYTFSH